ncbi:hypothetical protein GCM10027418_11810 [Mariniluteicoccus endophyticus]
MPRVDEHEPTGSTPLRHDHHPHLIDADEDRWRWRAKIRRNPTQLFFYRIGVAVVGLLLMVGAALTGPLPGPGGIPLFLLGLAVWASEFEWAQDLMLWFKAQFRRYRGWRWPQRLLFWVVFALCCWLMAYLMMLVFGPPPWLPAVAREWLAYLPGL